MRRKDREIRDMEEIMKVIKQESICCVAFHDEPCPYLIPLNYGARMEDGMPVLYFHGAKEGTKLDLIRKNPRVSYTIYGDYDLRLYKDEPCRSSAGFVSVCGSGHAELVGEEELRKGLSILMNHMGGETCGDFREDSFPEAACASVQVWKIVTDTVTGKRHE